MAVRIKYKGETLETLSGGKATTLYTKGAKLESDIRVEVDSSGADPALQEKAVSVTENGTVEVTPDSGYDGLSKAVVTVNVEGGTCSGEHVIPVDELPTENIDTNAVYLCKGAYYKYANEIIDAFVVNGEIKGFFSQEGLITSECTMDELPNATPGPYIYYIESESAFYWNMSGEWEVFGACAGVITDESEATADGYYAFASTGFKKYLVPSGTLTVTESGSFDVAEVATVEVDIHDAAVCGVWRFNDTLVEGSYHTFDFAINFSDGGATEYASIWMYVWANTGIELKYKPSSGSSKTAYYKGSWKDDAYKTIDFGADPQLVPSVFKEWLVANATPVEAESGGAGEFNIAYGDTAPEDTTKLWVKTAEPEAVQVVAKNVAANEELETDVATLPTATHSIAAAVVGKKAYLFGGQGGGYRNTINVFDTETETISTLSATLPGSASNIAAAKVGTKVYLFGGRDGGNSFLATINVFDTEANTISTLSAKLPTAAYGIASAVIGTKVYLFGGYGGGSYLSTINVYDTETNTITTLSTTLPTAAHSIAAAVVGKKVYLFGGNGSSNLNTINVYDTEANTISTLSTKLPTNAGSIASAVIGTKVYLFGGYGMNVLNTINVFDTETETISTLSATLPAVSRWTASAVIGTKVYLFGGYSHNGSSWVTLNAIHAFVLSFALAANNLLMEASLTDNLFNLLPSLEIGVKNVYKGNADGVGEIVSAALYKDGAWTEI